MSGLDSRAVLDRLRSVFGGFTAGQKAVLGVAVVALLVGGALFVGWASKPTYAPVFTNLSATDAAAVTAKLDEAKVPYQLADGGSSVLVPKAEVYKTRIQLSAAGLPSGGTDGWSLLDKQGIATSDFQQHVAYRRALEGELAKTVESIDGVQAAIVHLVVPQQDVFTQDQSKPTASVLVKTSPGSALSSSQVQAVVHLVSASVEGLDPANVTVADSTGRVLNAAGDQGATGDLQAEQQRAFEDRTAGAIQSMLDNVVGAGHAVVRVDADMSFDQTSRTSEQYLTAKGSVPLSTSTSSETYQGAGTPVGGVLGPGNSGVPNGTANGKSSYQKKQTDQTNAVGKVTEQTTVAPGKVQRMSVAVLLDSRTAGKVDVNEVSRLVSAAAGVDPKRGDTVQVSQMSFDTSAAAARKKELDAAAAAQRHQSLMSMVRTGAIVLVVLLVLVVLIRRSRRVQRMPVAIPAPRPGELTAEQLQELAAARQPVAVGASGTAALEAGPSDRRAEVRSQIGDLIEQQPDEVARLLRGWLADRRAVDRGRDDQ